MQGSTIDGAPEAVRTVLLAHDEGTLSPFERWYAEATGRTPGQGALGVDAIVAAFFRLNGGLDGVRWLARAGLSDVYVQQLERTIGRNRAVEPSSVPEAAPPSDSAAAPLVERAGAPAAAAPTPPRAPREEPPSSTRRGVYAAGLLAGAAVGVALILTGPEWAGPRPPPAARKAPPDAPAPSPPPVASRAEPAAAGRRPRPATVARARPKAPPAPRPPVATPPAQERAPRVEAAAKVGKHIRVNMARRRVEVLEGGKVVRVLEHVSFGRTGHRTPVLTNASLSPTRRERMHRSKLYDGAPMPYALFLEQSPNIAFHAGDTGARSHGCIHLRHADAKWLFRWVGADPVRVDIRPA